MATTNSNVKISGILKGVSKSNGIAKVTDGGGHRNKRKQEENDGKSDKDTVTSNNINGSASEKQDNKDKESFRRDDGVRVEDRLQLRHLQQLLYWFQNHRPPPATPNLWSRKPQRAAGLLDPKEFKEIIWKVLGTHEYDDQLDNLFIKLDTSCDGYVDWNEFSTYLLLQFRENDYMRAKKMIPFQQEAKIRHIIHNRQETTSKILAVDNPIKLFTISKEGAICCWDTGLHFERYLPMTEGEEEAPNVKRRVREWVTDALYMPNCHKIAIASTGRDLRFFDATSSSQFYEEFYLFAMPDVPSCLAYHYDKKNPSGESFLMSGDDHGNINIIYFLKPRVQLFTTPFKKQEGVQRVYYQDLIPNHEKYVRLAKLEDVHPEVIRKIIYMPENDCIMSSSASPRSSIVVLDVMRKQKQYTFKLSKGVDCFDYNREINLLVTGSADHLVRLWNPYVTSKPMAILEGHSMSIVDVIIHQKLNQVFTYSRDTVLKIWDVKEHSCLQTIVLKFPSSLLGRMPEYGPFSMHLQHTPNVLLVTANDYVAMLKVGQAGPPSSLMPTSHQTQLCAAIYNPFFKQVVTGADDSTLGVWDLDTGAKDMLFTNAHGAEEITCITFDNAYRRLFSGARNGTIKVWNIQNGHNLQQLDAVTEAEVTGIVPLVDRKIILSVGWSRKIAQYEDTDHDSSHVKANTHWKPGQVHQEDILTAAYLPPILLATASYDGEIYVWALETETLYLQLRKRNKLSQASASSLRSATPMSRPNSRHRKSHRPPMGQNAPVDKLLFLLGRTKVKRTEAAILVSSEAGSLKFWSIYGAKHELGYFYAPDQPDESVLALCSDPESSVLVSGDTHGRIVVWNIENYCMVQQQHRVKGRPPLLHGWTGHDSAIVSVEWVDHDAGQFILTASTDRTAKLWSRDGHCVGLFGQKQSWNLRNPITWMDVPPEAKKFIEEVKSFRKQRKAEEGQEDDLSSGEEDELVELTSPEENGLIDEEESIPTLERGDTLIDDTPASPTRLPNVAPKLKAHTAIPDVSHRTKPAEFLGLSNRSRTYAFGFNEPAIDRHLLGSRVEAHLSRITHHRHERRELFGEVTQRQANKMGKICCPFGALATKELTEIELPGNLPVTPRMINRGYNTNNLSLDTVRNMDLSYYTVAPPSEDQSKPNAQSKRFTERRGSKLPNITRSRTQLSVISEIGNKPDKRVPITAVNK